MSHHQLRRVKPAALGLILSVIASVLVAAGPAHAADTYPRPADGTFQLQGHGYGHGKGMSQWGAQGAAIAGRTYSQILAHYYPGTTLATGGPSSLRVWISVDTGDVWVRPSAGLSVTAGSTTALLPTTYNGAAYSSWRVALVSGQHRVDGYASGAWRTFRTFSGAVRLTNSAKVIRLILPGQDGQNYEREYRGSLLAHTSGGTRYTLNDVTMQSYLRSVVPLESFPSWLPAALQAQSVAARTYAAHEVGADSSVYDVCDTTSCQVYKGVATTVGGVRTVHEATSTNDAVGVTSGKILTYGGVPAFTQFSASNGGYSAAGGKAYLPAKADPYDAAAGSNPNHTWATSLKASTIESKYPQVGSVHGLRVLTRDGNGEWGGRVKAMEIYGSKGSIAVTGESFRFAFGLKSEWFQAGTPSCPVVTRLFGATRFATSVVEGRAAFPNSDDVVLVSADPKHMADGVVAAPFAFGLAAPVLLTERSALPGVVAQDIADRDVSTAYIIGGTIPIATSVKDQLADLGVTNIVRFAGATRYETAAMVADAMDVAPSAAIIASGEYRHLIDALVAGGPAARQGWPILLTRRDDLPSETAAALDRMSVPKTYVIGGTIPITDAVLASLTDSGHDPERLAGGTLYTTATAVAAKFASAVGTAEALVASGERANIIDALGGGTFGRIIVLSGRDALPSTTDVWLRSHAPYTHVTVLGGPLAVSDKAYRAVEAAVCS